jgi:hypothetical protein
MRWLAYTIRFLYRFLHLFVVPCVCSAIFLCLFVIGLFFIAVAIWLGGASFAGLFFLGICFAAPGVYVIYDLVADKWRNTPASEEQKSYARDLEIDFPPNVKRGAISELIDEKTRFR